MSECDYERNSVLRKCLWNLEEKKWGSNTCFLSLRLHFSGQSVLEKLENAGPSLYSTRAIVKAKYLKRKKRGNAPFGGFAAETAGAMTLLTTAHFGIPVSTTHTITGAIVGVGASRRLTAVPWGVTRNIVWAWLLTIPGAAFLGAILFRILAPC